MSSSSIVALAITIACVATPAPAQGGFPPPEETQRARAETDYHRAITAYRFWYRTNSWDGIFNRHREKGFIRTPNVSLANR